MDKSVIPDYLLLFEEDDMKRMWQFMFDRYHLHNGWKAQFEKELLETPRGISTLEFFFTFLVDNIDPVLRKLVRSEYCVIFKIAKHLIQPRIDMKLAEKEAQFNFYRNGNMIPKQKI